MTDRSTNDGRDDPLAEDAAPTDALPARWSRGQRLKNGLIYRVLLVSLRALQHLPLSVLTPVFAVVGWLAGLLPLREQRRALANLRLSYPAWGRWRRWGTMLGMFAHLGRSLAEGLHLAEVLRRAPLGEEPTRVLREALAEGRGVVAVSGHIGNWELSAQLLAHAGFDVVGIAKPLYDPRLTRWVHEARTAFGLKLMWRGDATSAKAMLRVFKRGGILALLIDQDTRVPGVHVPFFGRPAYTPSAAAALALRVGAPVVVGWSHRVDGRHRAHFERVSFAPSGDADRDVTALTAQITRRLEEAIRERPEQWVWLHDRWKTPPP